MMEQREKLIELIKDITAHPTTLENDVNYLIANGVVVLPCRCVECFHYRKADGYCAVMQGFCGDEDFFCACAKRKGGDER